MTILILTFVHSAYGSDSLRLTKIFPKIETKILSDTIFDIRGTELDTFGFIPDIIFVVRDYNGLIAPTIHYSPSLLIYGTQTYYVGPEIFQRSSCAIELNNQYHSGKKYVIRFSDRHLKERADTIDFRTLVEIDSLKGRTCVYEIQLGRDEWNSECIIQTTMRFSKKDRELITQICMNQDLYGVFESEIRSQFCEEVKEKLYLPDRKKRKIGCYCDNRPNSN